jgi:hypothetical protein
LVILTLCGSLSSGRSYNNTIDHSEFPLHDPISSKKPSVGRLPHEFNWRRSSISRSTQRPSTILSSAGHCIASRCSSQVKIVKRLGLALRKPPRP